MKAEKKSKADIKKQIRVIKRNARKKLLADGSFITFGFGSLLLMIFVSSAKGITSAFYRVFDMTLFTGQKASAFASNGRAYFETLLCIMLCAPLLLGIKSLCVKIAFGSDSSADGKRIGIGKLFSMFDVKGKYCFSLLTVTLKILCPILALACFKYIITSCEIWKNQLAELLLLNNSAANMPGAAVNFSDTFIAFAKLVSGIILIKILSAILRYLDCIEFIFSVRCCIKKNGKGAENGFTFKKYIIYGFRLLATSGKKLKYINRGFLGFALLSLASSGAAGVFALPYYLTVKSECLKSVLCENRELFNGLCGTGSAESSDNTKNAEKLPVPLLPAEPYTAKTAAPLNNCKNNKNI